MTKKPPFRFLLGLLGAAALILLAGCELNPRAGISNFGITSLAFSPDNSLLVAGGTINAANSNVSSLLVWDRKNKQLQPTALPIYNSTLALDFSPDGRTLASAHDDKNVWLWSGLDTAAVSKTGISAPDTLQDLKYSPAGAWLAGITGRGDPDEARKPLQIPNALGADGLPALLVVAPGYAQARLAFSRDGKFLAASEQAKPLYIWTLNQADATPLQPQGAFGNINAVAFSPLDHTLAIGGSTGASSSQVQFYSMDPPQGLRAITTVANCRLEALAYSPKGDQLAVGCFEETVQLFQLNGTTTSGPTLLQVPNGAVQALAFSPDGKTLAAGSLLGKVYLWDTSQLTAAPTVLSAP